MVYAIMVFASRKDGISHEEFKARYEQHMHLVEEISGDTMPLKHTRWYPKHGGPGDMPLLIMGNAQRMNYDVVATIVFEDEPAWGRWVAALQTKEAAARIEADEDGFWDRDSTHVVTVGDVKEWSKE